MKKDKLKKEILEELEKIENEWEKHRTMNKCSICDSPNGHTTIRQFLNHTIDRAREEERKHCVDLLDFDHSKCSIKETCIGYQNAQSDLMNSLPMQKEADKPEELDPELKKIEAHEING